MSTFHERKLMRIIKALQDDLPNIQKYNDAPECPCAVRLIEKRVQLQRAKGVAIWKVGSDGINMVVQSSRGGV